ncbi:nup43 [Trichonephila clavipes]|nr:nup43 [Trichonephila clavipes]
MDSTGLNMISKLTRLGQRKQMCLQWIPLHVGVPGKEITNELAGRGCDLPDPSSTALSHSEIYSLHRRVKLFYSCFYLSASPTHRLDCWGISLGQLFDEQDLVYGILLRKGKMDLVTATAGSDVVQSGRPIFDNFLQHLWPYIGYNTANVVFQMVKRLWLIRIDQ